MSPGPAGDELKMVGMDQIRTKPQHVPIRDGLTQRSRLNSSENSVAWSLHGAGGELTSLSRDAPIAGIDLTAHRTTKSAERKEEHARHRDRGLRSIFNPAHLAIHGRIHRADFLSYLSGRELANPNVPAWFIFGTAQRKRAPWV